MKKSYRTNAKVNLCLYILNQRPDGYHNLFTVFQEIDLYDTLTIEIIHPEADLQIHFTCDHPDLPRNDQNLVVKAAKLLGEMYGGRGHVHLALEKHIPIGSGLGGGSSNAAKVLLALSELWGLNLKKQDLIPYARNLGADVPFFLFGGTMIGQGIGDRLEVVREPVHKWVVLIDPQITISTVWAYKNIKLALTNVSQRGNFVTKFPEILEHLHNDFEYLVFPSFPILAELKSALLETGAESAAMSGSGSSLFGLFSDPAVAKASAAQLHERYPDFRFYVTTTIPTSASMLID
ncbi:MAG: 4-(cytidine 5'-diphospho)-2-C-methyl-D-erythritol kinase [Gemmatimonadetes bacterium]|nr:MAG: 4-(cytidine 5'-diphospho)-2-C-methyl-D-erythritol kinase [Gemmatimonadota bacterium]